MSAPTKTMPKKKNVALPVVILAIVAALAFVVLIGYKSLAPPPPPAPAVNAGTQWIIQAAQKSKGSYDNLSPADQQKLQQITHGMGRMALSGAYKAHGN